MPHKYAEILRAMADGQEEFQLYSPQHGWSDINADQALYSIRAGSELRLKPDTIKIGTYDVPKPVTNPCHSQWRVALSIVATQDRMITGMEHATQEAAWTHAKALASLTC